VTVIADYTDDEQQLLRAALEAAAVAISAASPGRQEETASEGFAAADFVLKSQPRYVGNTLVTSILVQLEEDLKHDHVFPDYQRVATAPGALDGAMNTLARVTRLLDQKTPPQEAAGYKRWLLDIARVTAQAGKEDQGFLGMGGVMVNDAERSAYQAVAGTLGVTASEI
jgi:hypothetical protein